MMMQGLRKAVTPGMGGFKPLAGSPVQAQVQSIKLFCKARLIPHGRKPAQGILVLGKILACRIKPPLYGPHKGGLCLVNPLRKLGPCGPQQLRRVRGGCRAHVCGHVGKGNVYLMPNASQHRQARLKHGLGYGIFIKGPQIF